MTADELRTLIRKNGWSIKEFASIVGVSEGGLRAALSTGKISTQLIAAAKLAQRVAELEQAKSVDSEQMAAAAEFVRSFEKFKNVLN